MNSKFAKFIRTVTIAPVMAALLLTILYFNYENSFYELSHYLFALFFLAVLPVLAYPVAAIVPKLKKKGRKGQRDLAIVFAVIGYVSGTLLCAFTRHTTIELVIYLTYLISGVAIALLSVFHVKGSGHACGVSGPIALLSYFLGLPYLLGYIILAFVFKSSVVLKRHTVKQLLIGSIVPVAAFALSVLNVSIIPF